MKVLVVGPSSTHSKGGMATVIREIEQDKEMCDKYNIDSYASYIDGNKVLVGLYSVVAFIKFYLTKRNYDIYHIHVASNGSTFRKGYYVRAAKKWGKKIILHIHGAKYLVFYNELNDSKKCQVVKILEDCDKVIALSEDWKQKFEDIFKIKNCIAVENGINIRALEPAKTDVTIHKKNFVTLGRLGKRKGTYDLLDAMELARKQIKDIKLFLAGDGDIEDAKKIIQEKHLEENVEIVGWADLHKKIELLSKVSTVILPSYNEGLPMSILEGMACGKAIISTTVGAIPEVVKEDNGILIEPGDVSALAKAITDIASGKVDIEKFSENNIYKIENEFSMQTMHEKLEDVYEAV